MLVGKNITKPVSPRLDNLGSPAATTAEQAHSELGKRKQDLCVFSNISQP